MMARMLAVGVLVAATLTGVASPARATLTGAAFGETGTLTADGRAATVSLRVACTDNGRVGFTVTLTQGDVSGVRRGTAQCNQTYDTTFNREEGEFFGNLDPGGHPYVDYDRTGFEPGPADACGHVIYRHPGGGEEDYRWCSEILLQSERQ